MSPFPRFSDCSYNLVRAVKDFSEIELIEKEFQARQSVVVDAAVRFAPASDLVYDIVQQTFIDFAEHRLRGHEYEDHEIAPLLYKIAKNRALKFCRVQQIVPANVVEYLERHLRERLRLRDGNTLLSGRLDALNRCLDQLPEKSREMIDLHYADGETMEVIAHNWKMSVSAVRQFFCRIRAKLRQCIDERIKKR